MRSFKAVVDSGLPRTVPYLDDRIWRCPQLYGHHGPDIICSEEDCRRARATSQRSDRGASNITHRCGYVTSAGQTLKLFFRNPGSRAHVLWYVGNSLRHSAGCVWDDICDRDLDRLVGVLPVMLAAGTRRKLICVQNVPKTDLW